MSGVHKRAVSLPRKVLGPNAVRRPRIQVLVMVFIGMTICTIICTTIWVDRPSLRSIVKRQDVPQPPASQTELVTANFTTSVGTQTPTTTADVSTTATATNAISTSTRVPANYQVPTPFDTTLGGLGERCTSFIATLLQDQVFLACAPFSFLLTSSSRFNDAKKSPLGLIPYILDRSCTAVNATCSDYMTRLASAIQKQDACGNELRPEVGNPIAKSALEGFRNYQVMREAGCTKNQTSDRYCFSEAILDGALESVDGPNKYSYFLLPQGIRFTNQTIPDCSKCSQDLLEVYAKYASNTTLDISQTYNMAWEVTTNKCGAEFAPRVAVAESGASFSRTMFISLPLLFAGMLVLPGLI